MNTYEVAVLYHPDLEIDLEKTSQKINKIFTDNKGKVVKTDDWGKRKLAYKIKGHDHAVYVFYTVELPGKAVSKVEQTLNITDEVIRFLITRPDQKAIAKAEAYQTAKAKRNKAKEAEKEETSETSKEEE